MFQSFVIALTKVDHLRELYILMKVRTKGSSVMSNYFVVSYYLLHESWMLGSVKVRVNESGFLPLLLRDFFAFIY